MKDYLWIDFLKQCMECCCVCDVASVVENAILKVRSRRAAHRMYWTACWIFEQGSDDMVT